MATSIDAMDGGLAMGKEAETIRMATQIDSKFLLW